MHKLLTMLLASPSDAFARHFQATQKLVRRQSTEPVDVTDWSSASLEVLESTTDECLESGSCDLDELVDIKSSLQHNLKEFDGLLETYSSFDAEFDYDDANPRGGAAAEDRALAMYLRNKKTKGIQLRKKVDLIDELIAEKST
mmetsp:Transcript_21228/g.63359  ORF Transcript_21228/g.63359 Transcript_21228/m.63359 type:complete len:143 (+) Transcript_21228:257-685(+)